MQISDMLGQYNRNVKNGTEELLGAQGTQKLVTTLGDLEAGNIFEGTVNSIKNGKVTLALGNGQVISARLDGKININPGESMFFQVRSNDGITVAIKPYVQGSGINNPILLNALTAAGIPATERSITMVDMMMQEQMPIGRQSILDMARVLNNNPDVKVSTLVQMTKMGIPVSPEMASQFENYQSDSHAILGEMETAMEQLGVILGDESMSAADSFSIYSKVLDILQQQGLQTAEQGMQAAEQEIQTGIPMENQPGTPSGIVAEGQQISQTVIPPENPQNGQQQIQQAGAPIENSQSSQQQTQQAGAPIEDLQSVWQQSSQTAVTMEGQQSSSQNLPTGILAEGEQIAQKQSEGLKTQSPVTLEQLLTQPQLDGLKKLLQNVPTLTGNTEIFEQSAPEEFFVDTMLEDEIEPKVAAMLTEHESAPDKAVLNKNMSVPDFLNAVKSALAANSEYGFAGVQKLFSSREFQTLLKNMAEQQWLVRPEDLKESNKISELYQRVESQMRQMESVMKAAGITQNSFTQTTADIRGNIEFMNQVNQVYTYVQIPLKLSGQNASSELYVYTNKKSLNDPEAELTAFLHLDLENLGATDVSIRMKNKNVKTNFYIADDASYHLLEKHLPILEKRLKNKGYQCRITVTNEEKKVNLVEDFLQKDQPASAGILHRYSFDVRA